MESVMSRCNQIRAISGKFFFIACAVLVMTTTFGWQFIRPANAAPNQKPNVDKQAVPVAVIYRSLSLEDWRRIAK
jgi:hypothetical protein